MNKEIKKQLKSAKINYIVNQYLILEYGTYFDGTVNNYDAEHNLLTKLAQALELPAAEDEVIECDSANIIVKNGLEVKIVPLIKERDDETG